MNSTDFQNNAQLILTAYAIYLLVTIALVTWTSIKLFANGKVFMLEIFRGNEGLANSTNKLFEVGYFLLNIGFALLMLKISHLSSKQMLVEELSPKIGGFTIWLGVVFMVNVVLFLKGRKNVNRYNPE